MPFMPFQILGLWLRGLLSLAVLAAGCFLLGKWYENRFHFETDRVEVVNPERQPSEPEVEQSARPPVVQPEQTRRVDWQFGWNRETAYLLGGLLLLGGSVGGGSLGYRLWKALRARAAASTLPEAPAAAEVQRIRRPDGTDLHVELCGAADAPPVILTHGWGLDGSEWCYVKRALAARYRLIVWDLPGLGKSGGPADKNWSLEKMAGDLEAVLSLAKGRPAVLVGHSIGGMIVLTFCRLFPQALPGRVCGLALVHSTYTNPVRTTSMAPLYTAIQKPVLEPLCWLMIWLAPLVWVMNWLSYLNGSLHQSTDRGSFSGNETGSQLEFIARLTPHAWPAVVARGMLGMFGYDATHTLPTITVPALVVAGEDDRHCTGEASRVMSATIPGARLETLRAARHCGHFEYHEAFCADLDRFVGGCQSGARTKPLAVPQRV